MKKVTAAGVIAVFLSAVAVTAAGAANGGANLPVRDTSNDSPRYTTIGGATPLATTKTVPHWYDTFNDPTNGVTYGYQMVGTNPFTGSESTTIPADIIPVDVVFDANGGYDLNGADRVAAVAASPIFQPNDYSTTPKSFGSAGPAPLSAGNVGVQYEDAVMRSQFDKVGTGYHVMLGGPNVEPTYTITVPKSKGSAYVSRGGIVYGLVDVNWFSTKVMELLGKTHADPTHLPIVLTNNVMLYIGSPSVCCIIGYHGAALPVGLGAGSTNGNGDQPVQTFAYAAYNPPGLFSGGWVADIHALSHEISEWGDDPFVNNTVDPWLTPTAPQYGCTDVMETGDPVVGIGFAVPGNAYDTVDGYWHPEDEVFLPWFARQAPNTTSQPVQGGGGGRYTFMGDLNPFPGFQTVATGCN